MLNDVLHVYAFNLQFTNMLMGDVDDADIAKQPFPNANHPAWLLGHVAATSNFGCTLMGHDDALGADWGAKYGQGSSPSANRADYPSKADLLATLTAQHERLAAAITEADPGAFARPTPNEGLARFFPTLGNAVTFIATAHESTHIGQLSAWRRAMGKPSII